MECKILVCDDEDIIRQGIRRIIERSYPDVQVNSSCGSGLEAWKEILCFQPDIVIADIRMPGLNGLELIEKCGELEHRPQFVIVSAYDEFSYAQKALRFGVREYLLKPVNHFRLLEILDILTGECARTDNRNRRAADESSVSERARKYMEHNFYRQITLEEVSEKTGVTPGYLSAVFKRETGMKYIDYLTELRLEKAKNLIEQTDLKVASVASMVGYLSPKYFTRLYRRRFGVNPAEDRKVLSAKQSKNDT